MTYIQQKMSNCPANIYLFKIRNGNSVKYVPSSWQ